MRVIKGLNGGGWRGGAAGRFAQSRAVGKNKTHGLHNGPVV
ncbi:hypothetical protein [Candidatus Oleimmundimicrobium sp.]|nr:hypothetical protein [Candidatus Oleimmundimicrobium sp.]MDO8885776.1 hypothetical protein [Candidatus Oleimmundimicrobium sp.]